MASAKESAELAESEQARRDALWHAQVARAHAKWNTPEALVAEWVRRATGALPAPGTSPRRILSGLSNEVYEVALAGGGAVIVRISHRASPHFEQERWAIGRCREVGVPVPTVLLLEHVETGGGAVSVCVEEKLEGVPLGRVARELGARAPRTERLLREAGTVLARIHTVPTEGYGPLDGRGRGPAATWDAAFLAFLDEPAGEKRVERAAGRLARLAPGDALAGVANDAAAVLRAHRLFLRGRPARLLHHDYEPWHILVNDPAAAPAASGAGSAPGAAGGNGDRITGVIDLESCRGGDPAEDLVQWHVIHDGYAPVAPLVEGYRAAGAWTPAFAKSLRLGLLRSRLRALVEALEQLGRPDQPKGEEQSRSPREMESSRGESALRAADHLRQELAFFT